MFIALKENKCILYKCIILYGNVYKLLIHCIYIYIYIYILYRSVGPLMVSLYTIHDEFVNT